MTNGGPKPKYRKDFHPSNFLELSKVGKTLAQISKEWCVDRTTLFRWSKKYPELCNAIKIGKELSEAWWIDLGQKAMLGQVKIEGRPVKVELGWYVWLTKNLFKWNDRASHEMSGPDGKPIQMNSMSDITDEQLDARIAAKLAKAKE